MNLEKIHIITDSPIPIGMASTNRILSYASGFKENGIDCGIVIFRKTESTGAIVNTMPKGRINGVEYNYLFKNTIKSKYFVLRRLNNFIGGLRLFFYSLRYIKKNHAVIYYSIYTYPVIFLIFSKIFNNKIILKEESEHPSVYNHGFFSNIIFKTIHYRLFDGYLLMTNNLMNYFHTNYPNIPKTIIPMTVDLSRFENVNVEKKNIITYLGLLNDHKDGVNILIEAFSKIANDFKEYQLNLYGEAISEKLLQIYINKISELGLSKRIILKGKIDNSTVPRVLAESNILVLPRPNSTQADNGFPTKLGEYLASGVPVVVTSVGEIPLYLKDKESAFLAKPGDVKNLEYKLREAIEDSITARQIGLKGKEVAIKYFSSIVQTNKIINFINDGLICAA